MKRKKPPSQEPTPSAEQLYQQARGQWAHVVDLGLYDDEHAVFGVTGLLQKAIRQDGRHVKALALLSDLLMEVGAYDEASALVARLLELEPEGTEHRWKRAILARAPSKRKNNEIRKRLAMKWLTESDW
jgi:hypothetical protein